MTSDLRNTPSSAGIRLGPLMIGSAFALLALSACGSSGDAASGQQDPAAVAPVSWVDGFTLGTVDDPFRGITQDSPRFEHGERVQLRLNATNAAAQSKVRVEWVNPHGDVIGSQEQPATEGQDRLTFLAPPDLTRVPGRYVVRVALEGRRVYEHELEVVEALAAAEDKRRALQGH